MYFYKNFTIMRNAIMTIAALLGILVLSSCSKDNVKEETINGFNIQWEGELNKKQKDVIRLMIKDMVFVEGGDFQMGATAESDSMINYDSEAGEYESPVHKVNVSSFYINKFELTQDQWEAVTGKTPGDDATLQWEQQYGKGDKYPAYRMSFTQATEFINKLNDYTGLRFSLPSEAQWEYAARGGKNTNYHKYAGSNNGGDVAWTSNDATKCNKVGGKNPNELGLYDMSGNVWEMCLDWYSDYTSAEVTDPLETTYSGYRVFRGGSWNNYPRQARVTNRYQQGVHYTDYETGLRLVHPAQ